jgi:hypothetical protein
VEREELTSGSNAAAGERNWVPNSSFARGTGQYFR